MLLRQVGEHMFEDDEFNNQLFRVIPADKGLLSLGLDDCRGPAEAFTFHTVTLRRKSIGVIGITTEELQLASLMAFSDPCDIEVIDDDGTKTEVHDPCHACADFRGMSKPAEREARTVLEEFAQERWFAHGPIST